MGDYQADPASGRQLSLSDCRQAILNRFYIECLKAFCSEGINQAPDVKALKMKSESVITAVSGYMVAKFGIAESVATVTAGSMLLVFFRLAKKSICEEINARLVDDSIEDDTIFESA